MDTRISGKTRLLGVFGTPIKHSGSPIMYNFCFDYYGIDCAYLAFDTDASQVKDSLAAMRRLNMRGANVTMPCKQEVCRNMDKLSDAARFVGAVNTIVNNTLGYNSFIKKMNETAKKIGMNDTSFANPIGKDDENNYSTSNDLAKLLKYALKNETFKTVFTTKNYKTSNDNNDKVKI